MLLFGFEYANEFSLIDFSLLYLYCYSVVLMEDEEIEKESSQEVACC